MRPKSANLYTMYSLAPSNMISKYVRQDRIHHAVSLRSKECKIVKVVLICCKPVRPQHVKEKTHKILFSPRWRTKK